MIKTTTGTPPKVYENYSFLISKNKLAFLQLRQAFTKTLILPHLDPELQIRIETETSSYTIGGILSQLIMKLGQEYPIAFISQKIIPAET